MSVRACIRCSLPLERRTVTIGDRTHAAWVRVCHCESVSGPGWYWRNADDRPADPAPVVAGPIWAPPPPVASLDDDIPDFNDPIPPKRPAAPDILSTPEPLTKHYGASA